MAFLSPYQPVKTTGATDLVPDPVTTYNLRLLDINRKRIAIIDKLESWRYTRRPSEATEISVSIPREDVEAALPAGYSVYAFLAPYQVVPQQTADTSSAPLATYNQAQVAHFVEIYRGTEHVVTGRISKRDVQDDIVSITCHTEEIVLESHVTPAQYGRKWDYWDLSDVVRDLLHGWHVMRVKDKTQWDAAIEHVNVDTTTEPGVVMLAKDAQGRYLSSGYITLRFVKDDVPDFFAWDRIRWASDHGAPVRTTMQYRYGDGSTMSGWSDEVEGALPDEVGVVPGTADAEVIDVRINLYTDDTETQDAEGNPVGLTPYVFAVELIARTEGVLAEGDIPVSTNVLVSGLEADGASALNVLSQACEQVGWEFWVKDGKLNLAKQMGKDRTASVLLRAGTNMRVTTLTEGDEELVNILTAYGPGEGINRLQVTRRHVESIAMYGEYRGVQTFEGATDLASLIDAADEYLAEHAAPVPAYRVDVHYPYGTDPKFGCGDYVRVGDPRNGIITRTRIAEEQRSYSASGLQTTLYLGMPAPNLARQVRPTEPPRPVRPPDKPVISLSPIPGGIRVIDTKAPNIRWSTSEVHMSTIQGFTPSAETLVADGRRVRFDVTGLTPNQRYYVRLIRFDTDGNASEPSDEMSAVAGMFQKEIIPGDLFRIEASSNVSPTSGALENLWDANTATGAAWASGPVTIEFEYPMQWFFDMVRLYTTSSLDYYVEARTKDGSWVKVTDDHVSVAGGWTVQRFISGTMVVTDALRIVFPDTAAVDIRELKFWTITLADEILAQKLRLTSDMYIENEDGSVLIDTSGVKTVDVVTGDYSKLEAGVLAFYKHGYDTPHIYTKRIARGTTPSGYFVSLEHGRLYAPGEDIDDPTQGIDITEHPDYDGVDAIPWDRDPKVLPSISRLITYDDAYDSPQMVEANVDVLGTKGFWVYATHSSGGMDREVEQQPGPSSRVLQNGQTWISSVSRKNVNRLRVGVIGQGDQLGPFAWKHQYDIRLAYKREDQVEWTQFWRMARHDDFWFQGDMYQIYYWATVEVPPHPDYGYQIRLSIHNIDGGIRSAAQINSWMSYITKEIPSDLNAVSWIAIEGG